MNGFLLDCKKRLKAINWIEFTISIVIVLLLIGIDLFSKQYVYAKYINTYNENPYFSVSIIPHVINFSLAFNKGAAWSVGYGMVGLFSMISLVAGIILILFFMYYFSTTYRYVKVCFVLAIAGDLGNMVDRFGCWIQKGIYKDGVVDFITFDFWKTFPTFNIADSYLVIAIAIAIVGSIVLLIKSKVVSKKATIETESSENQEDFKNKLSMKEKEEENNK